MQHGVNKGKLVLIGVGAAAAYAYFGPVGLVVLGAVLIISSK